MDQDKTHNLFLVERLALQKTVRAHPRKKISGETSNDRLIYKEFKSGLTAVQVISEFAN